MSMSDDCLEDIERSGLKDLIGKKVVGVELRRRLWERTVDGKIMIRYEPSTKDELGNITLILDDGTCVQGTDGEYGTNTMVADKE